MADVATFYSNVIEDVINGMKETFTEEGVDLVVLEELKKLWMSKLADTHVADPEPVAQPAAQYAQRLQAAQFQQTCVGSVTFPRLPNTAGQQTALRALAPIPRANAPLTATAGLANIAPGQHGQQGFVLRTAVGGAQVARHPIVLAAALNPQQQVTQQRVANPVSIAIRAPMPNAPTIIGQAGMASVNGMQQFGIPGQLVQVGQQTFVLPFQIRSQIQGTQQIHQDASGDQILQNQTFNRTQVDGVGGDSDFDEDEDDLDDFDEPPPSLHHQGSASSHPTTIATAANSQRHPHPSVSTATPRSSSSVRHLGDNEEEDEYDDEDDEDGFVPATPGVAMTPAMTPAGGPMSVGAATPRVGSKRVATGLAQAGKLPLNNSKKPRFADHDDFAEEDDNNQTPPGRQLGDLRSSVVGGTSRRRKQKTPAANRRVISGTAATPNRHRLDDEDLDEEDDDEDDDDVEDDAIDRSAANRHHAPPELPPPEAPPHDGAGGSSDDPAVAAEEAAAAEEEDEEPLNSDDDVSDEEPESLFETDNLVVCQYDKVSRTRSKWRFVLRDGIMKIRGRDHIFSKLSGEADWLIGSGTNGVSS